MATRVVAAIGHRPGGLGDKWRPLEWMPAVAKVRDWLATRQAQVGGPLAVVVIPDEGFGLMVGCAALMLRGEGVPVSLWLVVPFYEHRESFVSGEAKRWWDRMLGQADRVITSGNERNAHPPRDEAEADLLRLSAWATCIEHAHEALVCWNGSRRCVTGRAFEAACLADGPVANLYGEVAQALQLRSVERRRARREAGYGPAKKRPEGPRPPAWFGLRAEYVGPALPPAPDSLNQSGGNALVN